jgi:hypothetical protein
MNLEGRVSIMRPTTLLATVFIALLALPAFAQNPPEGTPTRVRGTVDKLDGQTLTVKSRDGQVLTIALAANVTVVTLVKKNVADIKAGDYVASTGVKGTDGKIHAVEVRIFPEAMRGGNEGQFPWDLMPDSVMTNATVGKITEAPQGPVLHVTFKGGESEYSVGPDVPVLTYGPGDTGLLKPGTAVFVGAFKKADGTLTAARVTAEKDGVKPPM